MKPLPSSQLASADSEDEPAPDPRLLTSLRKYYSEEHMDKLMDALDKTSMRGAQDGQRNRIEQGGFPS